VAASPDRCAKENKPQLPTFPSTLLHPHSFAHTQTHTHTITWRLFSSHFSVVPLASNLPLFSLTGSAFLSLSRCSKVSPKILWWRSVSLHQHESAPLLCNKFVLRGEVLSRPSTKVTLQSCWTQRFLFCHQPGSFTSEWLTTRRHWLRVCTPCVCVCQAHYKSSPWVRVFTL